ncbi:DNA mismatch repair protein [uncultured Cytophaga sp.]|uniref:MutS-related protein n=1 Tax=uncultured Cytophaga sp. TaxID=160238 RepID=UPI00260B1A6C|nr:DNA mismatch repair protein [uncultured Cytophaga sp.]
MNTYTSIKETNTVILMRLKKLHFWISMIRIALVCVAIVCFYFFITSRSHFALVIGLGSILLFPFILTWHRKKAIEIEFLTTVIKVNQDEIQYQENKIMPFEDGSEYMDVTHSNTFDLDVFGPKGLFQHLNRTATYLGKFKLAFSLQNILSNDAIVNNQLSIKELSNKLKWRQEILAHATIASDSKDVYNNIIHWASEKVDKLPLFIRITSFAFPILLFVLFTFYLITDVALYLNAAELLLIVNLILIGSQLKTIKRELMHAERIDQIIKQYSIIIDKIEKESFHSEKLIGLKNILSATDGNASKNFNRLSKLFARVETINNAVGAFLLNGFFFYHIHSLHSLLKWKDAYASKLPQWIDIIAEFEMLNSYANLAYNNPTFTFPTLNTDFSIQLTNVGHPLIDARKRVCNSIDFTKGSFVILTGSNMSGKSTFLRTLGINMVLAGAGSPICASAASIHPLQVIVSMRLSDSLSDSESYFFAEVKRLKFLMNTLDKESCFVLLDEILRGTNSDDKRNGTIEVIKKIVSKQGIGIVATHDLEVCNTTEAYPNQLSNKCFEVEIIQDELVFDYKLRAGICQNKSATFLMKKMGVI